MHTQLGFNLRYLYYLNKTWTFITPQISLAWRHELLAENVSLKSRFASGEGDTFTVTGPDLGTDSIIVGLGCSIQWKPQLNTYINFTAEMGRSGYASQNLSLGVRYSF